MKNIEEYMKKIKETKGMDLEVMSLYKLNRYKYECIVNLLKETDGLYFDIIDNNNYD